jgi:hypothetical protein
MDKTARAKHAESLVNDDVLQNAFSVAYQRHCGIFADKLATDEEVLEARRMAFAIKEVQSQLHAFIVEGKILEKRNQDREHD